MAAGPRIVTYHDRRRTLAAPELTCIDLFAGAGGLAEGFKQAGFTILSANDIDRTAGLTFRANFSTASFFQCPIANLDGDELLADARLRPRQLDCLIGGPPCQSFSYNNHERSRRKARARLFRDYLRIVESLEPNCLVMENVPGILTVGGGVVVEEIYDALSELGYQCEARILFAEDFGVPQQRRRVFFIATRLGWDDKLFPAGSHGPSPKPSPKTNAYVHRWQPAGPCKPERFVSVWNAIGDLPMLKNGDGAEIAEYTRAPRTDYQSDMRRGVSKLWNHVAPALSKVLLERISYVPEGGNWRDIPRRLLPSGMKRAGETDHTKRYGRLSRSGLCCTILTKCDPHWGSYVHPLEDRALSVRESARLQSFPDRFKFLGYRSDQHQQIGNAVPPLMAAAVARAVRAHIDRNGRQTFARAA